MTTTQRIAGAPISWGVSEVPGWGHQMRCERVLAELRELGLAATEAGPDGFLPDDPGALRELLTAYDLTLASGFTPLVLHGDASAWRRDLASVAARFAAGGASIVVLAASTGLDDYDARPQLTGADWRRFLHALDAAREVAGEHGLEIALHPHYGTMVETPEEIDRVLTAYVEILEDEVRRADSARYYLHRGMESALDRAAAHREVALGLGTGNIQEGARVKLQRVGVYDRFRFGGFGSDHEERVELIRRGAERGAALLGTTPADCRVVIIGDTPKDVAAAKGIGAECVGVGTGSFTPEQLLAAGANAAFKDLGEPGAIEAVIGRE